MTSEVHEKDLGKGIDARNSENSIAPGFWETLTVKSCVSCGITKDLEDFPKRKDSKDGRRNTCKSCRKAYMKKYQTSNKAYFKEYHAAYHKKHAEKILDYKKEYYQKNSTKIKVYKQEYRKNNSLSINKNHANYVKRRKSEDINFRLRINLRARFGAALKNNYKTGSAIDSLGCSVEELRTYLENQFTEGMTWENYGKHGWHIDHIRPLCSFDLTVESQLNQACHYTNLQPLWAKDNLSKGGKYDL